VPRRALKNESSCRDRPSGLSTTRTALLKLNGLVFRQVACGPFFQYNGGLKFGKKGGEHQ